MITSLGKREQAALFVFCLWLVYSMYFFFFFFFFFFFALPLGVIDRLCSVIVLFLNIFYTSFLSRAVLSFLRITLHSKIFEINMIFDVLLVL